MNTIQPRKDHRCRYCNEVTPKGESCVVASGFDCDGPYRVYFHSECYPMTKDWHQEDWETVSPGEYKRPSL